ncbi:glycosyltransferase family 4 protein [Daejeonella sp. H1SJ63]|uniref:glycosyltransferase family 4 protein n=1 Tax=Daejeonella sp. H1SJ63 TaxID=3034145 RepID=UPI0023ECE6CB|nr:glycosyltransferase family 4 protein [Daejeonella sp. H1SJ63]
MKILFIAPLPPPITGHSLASKVFYDSIESSNEVAVVNLTKGNFKEGADGVKRFFEIGRVLWQVTIKRKNVDLVYLTISESLAGNLKDIVIYLICFSKLQRTYIHLHGGSIKKLLFNRFMILAKVNAFFIRRLAGVIVLGESHIEIFDKFIPKEKIHIVSNSVEDSFFIDDLYLKSKFDNLSTINILFLSNLINGKGYNELLDAFVALNNDERMQFSLHFAGTFESEDHKNIFLEKIGGFGNIHYHGVVHGIQKRDLLKSAHLFCLPTSYFEGQPISILEAYASGCVVLCTVIGGIQDIFTDGQNGFKIKTKEPHEIQKAIRNSIRVKQKLQEIAFHNRSFAEERFRSTSYVNGMNNAMRLGQ